LVLLFDEFDALDDLSFKETSDAFFRYVHGLLPINPEHLSFVFVIGRNINDLHDVASALCKDVNDTIHVSLLDHEDTVKLIRFSVENNTLHWSDETIEKVWQLTHGHPYLTQSLCKNIWNRLYDENLKKTPVVTLNDIENAIPKALQSSHSALDWLWKGLPAAGRVMISVLAEAGAKPITENELEHLLGNGVRTVIRELQNATRLLQDWDLIEPVEKSGYRFRVELLRRWIAFYKPLNRLQNELAQVQKEVNIREEADIHYNNGLRLYKANKQKDAHHELNRAVIANPTHEKANQKLAELLIEEKQYEEARKRLEHLYKFQPVTARERLISVLFILAETSESEDGQQGEEKKLEFYKRILELNAEEDKAKSRLQKIWQRRGNEILGTKSEDDFEDSLDQASDKMLVKALKCYHEGQLDEQVKKIETEQHCRTMLAGWYQQAKKALKEGKKREAQKLLSQIINIKPTYEESSRYLYLAVNDTDPNEIKNENRQLQNEIKQLIDKKKQNISKVKSIIIPFVILWCIAAAFILIKYKPIEAETQLKAEIQKLKGTSEKLKVFNLIKNYKRVLVTVRSDFKPFSYLNEKDERVGFEVDIVREFARRWFGDEKEVIFRPRTADYDIDSLIDYKTNLVTTVLPTEENKRLDFSVSYFQDYKRLLVRQDSDIKEFCDIEGKEIAVVKGSVAKKRLEMTIEDHPCDFKIRNGQLKQFDSYSMAIEAIKKDEVEVVVADNIF